MYGVLSKYSQPRWSNWNYIWKELNQTHENVCCILDVLLLLMLKYWINWFMILAECFIYWQFELTIVQFPHLREYDVHPIWLESVICNSLHLRGPNFHWLKIQRNNDNPNSVKLYMAHFKMLFKHLNWYLLLTEVGKEIFRSSISFFF